MGPLLLLPLASMGLLPRGNPCRCSARTAVFSLERTFTPDSLSPAPLSWLVVPFAALGVIEFSFQQWLSLPLISSIN